MGLRLAGREVFRLSVDVMTRELCSLEVVWLSESQKERMLLGHE